jgi:hypothetical protein
MNATATMATFRPKNKSLYTGKYGRALYAMAGQPCTVLGRTTYPADQTKDRKPYPVVFIRFANSARTFQVRPQDVEE